MESLFWRLFSFHGRVSRGDFAILFFLLLAVQVGARQYVFAHYIDLDLIKAHKLDHAIHMTPTAGLVIFLLAVVMSWVSLANSAKRLHDFGWSGWMILAPFGVMVGGLVAGVLVALAGIKSLAALLTLAGFGIGGLGGLALHAMLLFRRGDDGENGHPRRPREGREEVALLRSMSATRASSSPGPATAAARTDTQVNVYRSPQIKPNSFGRRRA